ncbi:MAG: hypothetical protein O2960_04590, partial [Verrucomicrobia bacterium]|nr:hypothetical protein [Verrucomicrobiota bacterium]
TRVVGVLLGGSAEGGLPSFGDAPPASKVARLFSSWQIGQGDYLKLREELTRFAETFYARA